MNISVTTLIIAILVLGILAFMVSIITQATKGLGFLAKIPTKLQVLILGIGLSLLAYFAYISYTHTSSAWYFIAGSVMVGIFVAVIASNGWDYVIELFQRFISASVISSMINVISGIFNTSNNSATITGSADATETTDTLEKK